VKHQKIKQSYRLRNWKQYNAALVERGSLTLWVSEEVLVGWNNSERSGTRGKPLIYSNVAIFCMASLQEIYHLPLRATEGLLASITGLLGVELTVPDYTTLCRRRKVLEVSLPRRTSWKREPLHMIVDSTGVKVYGEGEWKVREHGYTKRRTSRKLHIGADEATGEIVAAVVSTNNFTDGEILPDLLDQVADKIKQVTGDGGYDKRNCYQAIRERQARAAIPPQKNAKIWRHGNTKSERLERTGEPARMSPKGARKMEARDRISPAQFGRDANVSIKNNLR
jgi:IS5 family transposase